jgi:ATP-dependent Zn protease
MSSSPPRGGQRSGRCHPAGHQEMSRLLSEAEDRATTLLTDNRQALGLVVAVLLEKETISGDEFRAAVWDASQMTPDSVRGAFVTVPARKPRSELVSEDRRP